MGLAAVGRKEIMNAMKDLVRNPNPVSQAQQGAPRPPEADDPMSTAVIKLGKEVINHTTKLQRVAVAAMKVAKGLPRCLSGDEPGQKSIMQCKDPRSLMIDCMKVIKLDEGLSRFIPAIAERLETDIAKTAAQAGYNIPPDLMKLLVDVLAQREYGKYDERMFVIRKYVVLRFNEILARLWTTSHGSVVPPDCYFIRAKKRPDSVGDEDDESIDPAEIDEYKVVRDAETGAPIAMCPECWKPLIFETGLPKCVECGKLFAHPKK